MKFIRQKLEGVIECQPKVFYDERGYFLETYRSDKLADFFGQDIQFCQDNESKSEKGVLRGLHYQLPPFAQTKLVRVIKGKVLDVAVDIRKNSPTFGQYVSVILSGDNKKQLLIPRGFAHGFLTLEDETIFAYKVDNYYSADYDRGIRFDDSDIAIDWQFPLDKIIISQKDKKSPFLKDAEVFNDNVGYY